MGCKFDSNQEMEVCKLLVNHGIIQKPIEGKNVHIKLGKNDVDFLINGIFIEFHPCGVFGRNRLKNETYESYFKERRTLLDKHGFPKSSLILISNFKKFFQFVDKNIPFNSEKLSKYCE